MHAQLVILIAFYLFSFYFLTDFNFCLKEADEEEFEMDDDDDDDDEVSA